MPPVPQDPPDDVPVKGREATPTTQSYASARWLPISAPRLDDQRKPGIAHTGCVHWHDVVGRDVPTERSCRTRRFRVRATRKARRVIAEARDLLGGNLVQLDHHVIRDIGDIEVIHTFEGTETMQALIVGRDITDVGAFA
jgi:alkylation response protein AidB-like acyl-CoA dehydrogenase